MSSARSTFGLRLALWYTALFIGSAMAIVFELRIPCAATLA